jgi:AraC-like DNA-binding protein
MNILKIKDGFTGERSIVLPQTVVQIMEEDQLVKNLFVTDIGFYPSAAYHYRERKAPINQYVLIYVTQGAGWYTVDGKRREVSCNHFFIIPAGKPHAYGADKNNPWSIYWIHVRGDLAEFYTQYAYEPVEVKASTFTRIYERLNIFEEIMNTLENGYSIENLRYMSGLLTFFMASMRYINKYREFSSQKIDSDNMLEVIIHYMQENLNRRISIEELARYAGCSAARFYVLFKKGTGMSPVNYMNHLKIKEACRQLTETNQKIVQISSSLGIEDPYYFSRLFSDIMGMAPTEWRKKNGGGTDKSSSR